MALFDPFGSSRGKRKARIRGSFQMELAGLELATSWVRFRSRSPRADQCLKLAVRIAYEADSRPTLTHPVRLTLGVDSLLVEAGEPFVEVVDGERDVAVAGAEIVGTSVLVERQLQLLLLPWNSVEVVRRLELTVPDNR
jgi:hypothetical protein